MSSPVIKNSRRIVSSSGGPGGGGGGSVTSVNSGTDITVDNTDPANPIVNFTGTYQDPITVVANYSALPAVGTVTGEFYWCSASQGTKWLPGALGGTYYSAGLYYSNGISWEFLDVPYNATQAEVNTGTNTDKFVTPATLTNWSGNYWTKSGSIVELTTAADQLELQGPNAGTTGTFHIKAGDAVNQYIVLSEAIASPNSAFLTFKSTGGNAIAMGARFSAGAPLSYVFTNPSGSDLITIDSTTGALTAGIAGTRNGLINLTGVTSGTVTLKTASVAGTWSLTLPTSGGTADYALITNGSGVSSWSILPAAGGGTGNASYTIGDLLYASTTTALSRLAAGAAGTFLRFAGAGVAPVVSTLVLPNSATANCIPYATGTNTWGESTNLTYNGSWVQINRAATGAFFVGSVAGIDKLYLSTNSSGGVITTPNTTAELLFCTNNQSTNVFKIAANTNRTFFGGNTNATAIIHLAAGTATASTSPLKFTSGTLNTSAEAGAMEYNNTFHLTNSDATRRHIVLAPNTTKVTAGAPYTNDGYVVMNIGGTDFKVMTTA